MDDVGRRLAHLVAAEDASDAAVVSLDQDGSICTGNRAAERLLGQPLTAVPGRPLSAFFPELEARAGLLERVFAGERLEHLHLDLRRSSSLTSPVSMTLIPLRHSGGPVVRLLSNRVGPHRAGLFPTDPGSE